ncbi:hypothetical protein PVBG_05435 [Plasmodium vivax Brazil I]|uniref:Uncharacterized protein n=1 Tax=Plasmodium vivax (strain Brazil I) TaxID=1033975 RepID=A0A0J9T1L2_PLAV1|nr:hypothetical protein PVBG_05435 [Plasmodium vivax Brazil I]
MKFFFPICTFNHLYVFPFIFISKNFSSKELPSERFYEWLNSNVMSISQYYDDCKSLNDRYKGNDRIKKLCARLVKYIKSTPLISNEEPLKHHHCNLLSYWIYEQLVSYYEDNSPEPVHIFGNFLRILSELEPYLNDNKCKLDFNITMIQDRKEIKELYEYCIDHNTIIEKSKLSNDNCKKYYTYVENKSKLYEKYQAFCDSGDQSKCPKFHKDCEPYNPTLLLDQLECKDEMVKEKQLKGARGTDLAGTTSNSFPSNQSVSIFGNVFLGVVVTSMTSGVLYKVYTNLIKINK